jgi:hypothetical protein
VEELGEDSTALARPLRRRRAHGTGAHARAGGPPFPSTGQLGCQGGLLVGIGTAAHRRPESTTTAPAKKRREEEEAAAAVAAVELFKQEEEIEARAWAQGDGEVATGEGDAEAEVILVDSD